MGLNKRLIGAGATASGAFTPSQNFKVVTYTGNGGTQAITGVGFQPDLVWVKVRSTTGSGPLADSTRGTRKAIYSNLTDADYTFPAGQGVTSFDADGFSVGDDATGNGGYNGSGKTYVAWCWKANGGTTSSNTDGTITSTVQANQDAGFSIIKFTGNGTAGATIGHGLSQTPELYITKNLETAGKKWPVHTQDVGSLSGSQTAALNETAAFGAFGYSSTATVITTAEYSDRNESGVEMLIYAFHSVENFSKIGTYEGNGTTTGPMVETGFEPAMIIIKDADGSDNWALVDNKRATTNPRQTWLRPNLNNAEFTNTVDSINFYSNGFQVAGGTSVSNFLNENGNTFIYMAFAADPDTEQPTLADSFAVKTYSGNGGTQSITGFGFSPSMIWTKGRTVAYDHGLYDSVRGGGSLIYPSLSQAASTVTNGIQSFDADGVTFGANNKSNASDSTYVAWAWKADDNEPTIIPATGPDSVDDEYPVVAYYNIGYTTSGKFNGGYTFNGITAGGTTGSAIFVPQFERNTSIDFTQSGVSASGWFYSTGSPSGNASHVLFSMYGDCGFNIQYTSSRTIIYSGAINGSTNKTMPSNAWTHIAFTYSSSGYLKVYVNGSASSSYNVGTSALQSGGPRVNGIGGIADNGDHTGPTSWFYAFQGTISQARYFNSELTQANVNTLYGESSSDNETLDILGDGKCIAAYTLSKELSELALVSANANAGFSIVKWTGNGSAGKIPHGLSAAPEMIITKRLTGTSPWYTYNAYLNGGANPAYYFVNLNTSDGETNNGSSGGSLFNSTPPTSTIFNIGTSLSGSGDDYIAYCFHSVAGYSKFGSYTGNGSSQSITTGFQPDWLMFKRTDQNGWYWEIFDTVRGIGVDLAANTSAVEQNQSPANRITINTDGFTHTTANYHNISGASYIYMAFKIN